MAKEKAVIMESCMANGIGRSVLEGEYKRENHIVRSIKRMRHGLLVQNEIGLSMETANGSYT